MGQLLHEAGERVRRPDVWAKNAQFDDRLREVSTSSFWCGRELDQLVDGSVRVDRRLSIQTSLCPRGEVRVDECESSQCRVAFGRAQSRILTWQR